MQMNCYSMNALILISHEFGLGSVSADLLIDSCNHGVYLIDCR